MSLILKNGRILDPGRGVDRLGDLIISGGRIAGDDPAHGMKPDATVVDCTGLVVAPGFIDLYGRLPDLEKDAAAAAAGGFVTVVSVPDVKNPQQDPAVVENALHRAKSVSRVRILLAGALTLDLAGEALAEMGTLLAAGCVALSNGSEAIGDSSVLSSVLNYAARFGSSVRPPPIMLRGADVALERGGVVAEGAEAVRLGLRSVPQESEEIGIYRIAALARRAGAAVHISHVWSRRGVDALRHVRAEGARITASTTPYHLALDDRIIAQTSYAGTCRLQPPLGTPSDREAVIQAVLDGTIDAVATDHRPLAPHVQDTPLDKAGAGAVAYGTALALVLDAVGPAPAVQLLATGPASLLGLTSDLSPGSVADVVVFDPNAAWTVDREALRGSERNTPVFGRELKGAVVRTILGGTTSHLC